MWYGRKSTHTESKTCMQTHSYDAGHKQANTTWSIRTYFIFFYLSKTCFTKLNNYRKSVWGQKDADTLWRNGRSFHGCSKKGQKIVYAAWLMQVSVCVHVCACTHVCVWNLTIFLSASRPAQARTRDSDSEKERKRHWQTRKEWVWKYSR